MSTTLLPLQDFTEASDDPSEYLPGHRSQRYSFSYISLLREHIKPWNHFIFNRITAYFTVVTTPSPSRVFFRDRVTSGFSHHFPHSFSSSSDGQSVEASPDLKQTFSFLLSFPDIVAPTQPSISIALSLNYTDNSALSSIDILTTSTDLQQSPAPGLKASSSHFLTSVPKSSPFTPVDSRYREPSAFIPSHLRSNSPYAYLALSALSGTSDPPSSLIALLRKEQRAASRSRSYLEM